jgi:hypothetical protein
MYVVSTAQLSRHLDYFELFYGQSLDVLHESACLKKRFKNSLHAITECKFKPVPFVLLGSPRARRKSRY